MTNHSVQDVSPTTSRAALRWIIVLLTVPPCVVALCELYDRFLDDPDAASMARSP